MMYIIILINTIMNKDKKVQSFKFVLFNVSEPVYKVHLEHFIKTDLELLLDKQFGYKPRTIYDDVITTYEKYMKIYGSTNIFIITNKLKPQVYKYANECIQIVNELQLDGVYY